MEDRNCFTQSDCDETESLEIYYIESDRSISIEIEDNESRIIIALNEQQAKELHKWLGEKLNEE